MKKEEWARILVAKEILGLGEYATLREIKKAYRAKAKRHHPDRNAIIETDDSVAMYEITAAYQMLVSYCNEYSFPLTPGANKDIDAEEWWFDRFGQDPLWGKG
jgi:preprotein translocase subunit Sec63